MSLSWRGWGLVFGRFWFYPPKTNDFFLSRHRGGFTMHIAFLPVALGLGFFVCAGPNGVAAQSAATSAREVPARSLPVPDTVSPQMQALIARPMSPVPNLKPETTADWKAIVDKAAQGVIATLPKLREQLGVSV